MLIPKHSNPFTPWDNHVDNKNQIVTEEPKKDTTREWESWMVRTLFGSAVITGGVIFPDYLLDKNGLVIFDALFIRSGVFVYAISGQNERSQRTEIFVKVPFNLRGDITFYELIFDLDSQQRLIGHTPITTRFFGGLYCVS